MRTRPTSCCRAGLGPGGRSPLGGSMPSIAVVAGWPLAGWPCAWPCALVLAQPMGPALLDGHGHLGCPPCCSPAAWTLALEHVGGAGLVAPSSIPPGETLSLVIIRGTMGRGAVRIGWVQGRLPFDWGFQPLVWARMGSRPSGWCHCSSARPPGPVFHPGYGPAAVARRGPNGGPWPSSHWPLWGCFRHPTPVMATLALNAEPSARFGCWARGVWGGVCPR